MSITQIFILIFMSLFGGATLFALLVTWHSWYKDDSEIRGIENRDVGTLISCILIVLFFILRFGTYGNQ